MLNVTLFKRRGDPLAEKFRLTQGNRGDALCEWDYLTLDKTLKNLNPKFSVIDYADIKTLPSGLRDKVKSPLYIIAYYGNDHRNAMTYPDGSALEANSISQWIMKSVKKSPAVESTNSYADEVSNPEQPEITAMAKVDNTKINEPVKTEEEQVQETTKSLFNLGIGLGGTLLITALAISGVVVGSLAADNFNKDDDDDNLANSSLGGEDEHPLFIESITGGKLDFTKIWEERGPNKRSCGPSALSGAASAAPMGSAQSASRLMNTSQSKNSNKGKEEEMEAPIPANIENSTIQNSKMTTFDKHDDEVPN